MLAQRVIVAMLVVAAVAFSLWQLMPLRRRLWLLERLARLNGEAGAPQGRGLIGTLWRSTQAQSGKGCNACVSGAGQSPTRTSAGLRR